jgi:hypothetical protein
MSLRAREITTYVEAGTYRKHSQQLEHVGTQGVTTMSALSHPEMSLKMSLRHRGRVGRFPTVAWRRRSDVTSLTSHVNFALRMSKYLMSKLQNEEITMPQIA